MLNGTTWYDFNSIQVIISEKNKNLSIATRSRKKKKKNNLLKFKFFFFLLHMNLVKALGILIIQFGVSIVMVV